MVPSCTMKSRFRLHASVAEVLPVQRWNLTTHTKKLDTHTNVLDYERGRTPWSANCV